MRVATTVAIFLTSAVTVCALSACGGNDQPVTFKSGGMTHTFAQGEEALKNFPLPIYPNAKPIGANAATGDADDEHFMMLTSGDPSSKVVEYYDAKLKELGWTVSQNSFMPQLTKVDAHKDGYEASIMVSSDGKQTSINLAMSKDNPSAPKVLGQEFTPDKLNPPTD